MSNAQLTGMIISRRLTVHNNNFMAQHLSTRTPQEHNIRQWEHTRAQHLSIITTKCTILVHKNIIRAQHLSIRTPEYKTCPQEHHQGTMPVLNTTWAKHLPTKTQRINTSPQEQLSTRTPQRQHSTIRTQCLFTIARAHFVSTVSFRGPTYP